MPLSSAELASLATLDDSFMEFSDLLNFPSGSPPSSDLPSSGTAADVPGQRQPSGSDEALQRDSSVDQQEAQLAIERQAKLREKNRRAQRRLRERQKVQKEDLRKQIEQLSLRNKKLEEDKAQLQARARTLERVVEIGGAQQPTTSAPVASANQSDADYIDETASQFHDVIRKGLGAAALAVSSRAELPSSIMCGGVHDKGPGSIYHAYIVQLAEALLNGGDQPGTPAHDRLVELVNTCNNMIAKVSRRNVQMLRSIEVRFLEHAQHQHGVVGPEHTRRTLDSLALTSSQVAALLESRRTLLHKMEELYSQREQAMAALGSTSRMCVTSQLQNCRASVTAAQAAEALKSNIQAETVAVRELMECYHTVVTPVQQARCVVQAYPRKVDVLAMCTLLASEAPAHSDSTLAQLQQRLAVQQRQHAQYGGLDFAAEGAALRTLAMPVPALPGSFSGITLSQNA